MINLIVNEIIEIESFSPLRARYSSNSSKLPERIDEQLSLESDLDLNLSNQIQNKIIEVYHELKVNYN